MELIQNIMDRDAYDKYNRAQHRVKTIKGFYNHLRTYVIISLVVVIGNFIIINLADFAAQDEGFKNWLLWNAIIVPVIWGIVVLVHWIIVFKVKTGVFKNWEERKIQEIIDKEEKEQIKFRK